MAKWEVDNMQKYKLIDTKKTKAIFSPDYNYTFDKTTGLTYRWGKTLEDDPQYCPFGPEILDLEVSEGGCSGKCPWCYKSNKGGHPINMSYETFIDIINKMPPTLSQIAFGITDIDTNPDFILMMNYARNHKGIIPNFTMTGYGLSDDLAWQCSKLAGAIAISVYPHTKELAYTTIKTLTDLGMDQINIHLLYHDGNQGFIYGVLNDTKTDPRLEKLNAVVLLALKQRGRAKDGFSPMSEQDFFNLSQYCFDNSIPIGFDSCTAPKFEKFINSPMSNVSNNLKSSILQMSEPCESALMSSYINVHGDFYPCSFMEGIDTWDKGISVIDCEDFIIDIWYHPRVLKWRRRLLDNHRNCPVFKI